MFPAPFCHGFATFEPHHRHQSEKDPRSAAGRRGGEGEGETGDVSDMTYRIVFERVQRDHPTAGLEEYAGRTPEDAATTDIAVRNAVQTVRDLMREERLRGACVDETSPLEAKG